MSLAMGSSCFSQSPLHLSRFNRSSTPSSSSSSYSSSQLIFFDGNYAKSKSNKRNGAVMASLHQEDPKYVFSCERRAVLFLGVSVFPFQQFKAQALEVTLLGNTMAANSCFEIAFKRRFKGPSLSQNQVLLNSGYKESQAMPMNLLVTSSRKKKMSGNSLPFEKNMVKPPEEDQKPELLTEQIVLPSDIDPNPIILQSDTVPDPVVPQSGVLRDPVVPQSGVLPDPVVPQRGVLPNPAVPQSSGAASPFLSVLNELGIFSLGVVGALYALAQKENMAANATIESIKDSLKEKETAIFSMETSFESRLQNEQEERTKELRKAKEEQVSLMDQLSSANDIISGLARQLKDEKRLIEDLKSQIASLQTDLLIAGEDKRGLEGKLRETLKSIDLLHERIGLLSSELKDQEGSVQNLSSSLAGKELELKNLNSSYKQAKDERSVVLSEIQRLKADLVKNNKELEMKTAAMDALNAKVSSLVSERDDWKKKIYELQDEYKSLKLSYEKKEALNAEFLKERNTEIPKIQEQLEISLNEAAAKNALIDELTREKEDLQKKQTEELNNVQTLKHELETTKETLGKSQKEAFDLIQQLEKSKGKFADLEEEVSSIQEEAAKVKETLQASLEEAKLGGEILMGELTSAKEHVEKTKDELQIVSQELATTAQNYHNLQKEMVDVYKKAETAAHELENEKSTVSTLKTELLVLEKQIAEDQESRKSVDSDLEEAIKALDELNRNAPILSRELEMAYSQISNLEVEKEALYKSLIEEKLASKQAREKIDDAQNILLGLGKERESLENRSKKLEEELASAKGEILRLRSGINSSQAYINNELLQDGEAEAEGEGNVPASKKPLRRRRPSDLA